MEGLLLSSWSGFFLLVGDSDACGRSHCPAGRTHSCLLEAELLALLGVWLLVETLPELLARFGGSRALELDELCVAALDITDAVAVLLASQLLEVGSFVENG
eukprot:2046897-Rhodomonas_salina.1